MRDITVVHDKVGVYSHWMYSTFHEGIQEPWLTRYHHDYFEGRRKPNYPVPAIRQRDWVHIGYLSALNGFDTKDAFEFIKLYL